MKEFGDGFYKNNGEANNSEKKEPQKEGVETVKDDGNNKDGENGENNGTGNISLDDLSKILGSINDHDEDDDFFANESQSEWANWKTDWFPDKAEEIAKYTKLIGLMQKLQMAKDCDPFQEKENHVNRLKEKYGVDRINDCLMVQLLAGSTPGCKDTVFYDLDEPDSVRSYIDKELEKMQN